VPRRILMDAARGFARDCDLQRRRQPPDVPCSQQPQNMAVSTTGTVHSWASRTEAPELWIWTGKTARNARRIERHMDKHALVSRKLQVQSFDGVESKRRW